MEHHDNDGTEFPGATTAGPARPSTATGGRTAQALLVAVVVALLSLLGTAAAWATPGAPEGNATFTHSGANVYPADAVGVGCSTFGLCGGLPDALTDSAVPQYRSTAACGAASSSRSDASRAAWRGCSATSASATTSRRGGSWHATCRCSPDRRHRAAGSVKPSSADEDSSKPSAAPDHLNSPPTSQPGALTDNASREENSTDPSSPGNRRALTQNLPEGRLRIRIATKRRS